MLSTQRTHRTWIGFSLMLILGCIFSVVPALHAQPKPLDEEPDKAAEIKKLLKERRDLLQDVVKILISQYELGVIDLGRVVQAQREFLKSAVDLAKDSQERRTALKESVTLAEQVVKTTEGRFKAGIAGSTKVDVLQSKAILLEVRIELLREELKDKPRK